MAQLLRQTSNQTSQHEWEGLAEETHVGRDGPQGAASDVADRVEGAHHDQHVRPERQLVLVAAQAALPQRLRGALLLSCTLWSCGCIFQLAAASYREGSLQAGCGHCAGGFEVWLLYNLLRIPGGTSDATIDVHCGTA